MFSLSFPTPSVYKWGSLFLFILKRLNGNLHSEKPISMSYYFSSEVLFLLGCLLFSIFKTPASNFYMPCCSFLKSHNILKDTELFPFARGSSHNLRTPGHATCQPSKLSCSPLPTSSAAFWNSLQMAFVCSNLQNSECELGTCCLQRFSKCSSY